MGAYGSLAQPKVSAFDRARTVNFDVYSLAPSSAERAHELHVRKKNVLRTAESVPGHMSQLSNKRIFETFSTKWLSFWQHQCCTCKWPFRK